MFKNKKLLLILGISLLVVALGVTIALVALNAGNSSADPADMELTTYEIRLSSAAGLPLGDVGIYIYEDSTLTELVTFVKTDENGLAAFDAPAKDTYVAVLDKAPTGFQVEACYPLTGALTEIVLQPGKMSDVDVNTLVYKLGDTVMDFSVTGPDGTVYTLSELFEGKQAVVLNFFYNTCEPCRLEFPHLQAAYLEYSDKIAVLAMNPYDGDDASVAALQKELGVTFPMVKCGPEWAKIMQLSAYPTTVIIDRYGTISLIHVGSITDPKIFKDAFAYFTADAYVPGPVESILDLQIDEPEGTKENPNEVGGQSNFEATVEPGQVVYFDLYKVFNMYLQIKSEYAYVIYKGQTYYPENGVVGLIVSAPDTFSPVSIGIGNSGTEKQTFQVYLSMLAGTFNNPYPMALGQFDVRISAGNEQGVYYTYTAQEEGTLTLKCVSASQGVKYGYYLYNLSTSAMRNLEADSTTDETGATVVSITAKKGQVIQVCVGTLPDSTNSYPAGYFVFEASFAAGQVADNQQEKTLDYTVTVTDDAGAPMANVSLVVDVNGTQTAFTTDANGVATVKLVPGSYTGQVYLPDGYTADVLTFSLTEAAPNAQLTLKKIQKANYTVTVKGPTGAPVQDVFVRIGTTTWQRTDANGQLTQELEVGEYTVTIMVPEGYSGQTGYQFAAGQVTLEIQLGYPQGSRENPYLVTEYPFQVSGLGPGEELYCRFTALEEMTGLVIENENAYLYTEGHTYGPDAGGAVRFAFTQEMGGEVLLILGNNGQESISCAVEGVYSLGSRNNPEVLTQTGDLTVDLAAGDANGYYYCYTPEKNGEFTLMLTQAPGVAYEITLEQGSKLLLSESETPGQLTLPVTAGETVLIHVTALEDPATGEYPACQLQLQTAFRETTQETDPSDPSDPSRPEEPDTREYVHTVTVTDVFGNGQANIGVIFMADGAPVHMATTDDQGVAQMTALSGTYQVELFFSGAEYYYDKAAAVLTPTTRSITVELATSIDESVYEEIYILNGNPAYTLPVGGTHVQLGSGKPNFSAEYGSNCFFVFTPQSAGTWQIVSENPNVTLSFWGATYFINQQYTSADPDRNGAITQSISGDSVGNTTYVIGVYVDGTVSDVILNVARIGDPEFSISDQPWTEWASGSTHTNAWISDCHMVAGPDNSYYNVSTTPTYLDITAPTGTYKLWYDEANGYYRLYENGPVVLVDLNAANRFVSLYQRINGNGQYGGAAVTRYFFDGNGGFVRKENYTDYLHQCFTCVALDDPAEPGYHPLTKDLMYVLQNGFCDWWNPDSPNYMEGFGTANKEYAWMFACCYVQ